MVEEKAEDMLNELEERLQTFEFKSTSPPLDKWNGTSIIKKVFNREKLRMYKSKEVQLLNRLELWNDVCRIGKRTLNTNLDNGSFSSVKLCKIRKQLLRRTISLESIDISSMTLSGISCAAKLTETSSKKGSKIYNIPASKHDITVQMKLSDSSSFGGHDHHDCLESNQKPKRPFLFNMFHRKSEGHKSEKTKNKEGKRWTRTQNIYRNKDDKGDDLLKSLSNSTELSHQIKLLPSKFHVDTISNMPDTRKSFNVKKILVESTPVTRNHDKCNSSSSNKQNADSTCTHNADSNDKHNTYSNFDKCNTDPYFYKCNTDPYFYQCNTDPNFYQCNTDPNFYKRSNCLNDKNNTDLNGKCNTDICYEYHTNSNEKCATYMKETTKNDDEGKNPYNRTPRNMRRYEIYHKNKMRYFNENTQNQKIRKRCAEISTIQDYIDSIKENRSSIIRNAQKTSIML